jgi:hypothetical protein
MGYRSGTTVAFRAKECKLKVPGHKMIRVAALKTKPAKPIPYAGTHTIR